MNDTVEFIYTKKESFSILVVDDEALARTLLCEYISRIPQLRLVESCTNAIDALQIARNQKIDIIVTDIQMPNISGLEFIAQLPYHPGIILTTAYSEYALDSYDYGVVDYLLKPIAFSRFCTAINKAIEVAKIALLSPKAKETKLPVSTNDEDFIIVKADYKLYKINLEELMYMEGQQEYVTFHLLDRRITALYSLKNLMTELPSDRFIRVHKSYIVSIKYIEVIEGSHVIIHNNKIPVGASYRDKFINKFRK